MSTCALPNLSYILRVAATANLESVNTTLLAETDPKPLSTLPSVRKPGIFQQARVFSRELTALTATHQSNIFKTVPP